MNLEAFKIPFNPLGALTCTELLDFQDYPILTVEQSAGHVQYLSYLVTYLDDGREQRLLAPISAGRLVDVRMGKMPVRTAFSCAEGGLVHGLHLDPKTNVITDSFLIASESFAGINPIADDYTVYAPSEVNLKLGQTAERTLAFAKEHGRVSFDLYVQGTVLSGGVKPWVLSKVFQPTAKIFQDAAELSDSEFGERASFTRLKVASFGVTIELDYEPDLFDQGRPEFDKLKKLVALFSAETKDDVERLIKQFRDETFIKEYVRVVRTIRKYDLSVTSTLANPSTGEVVQSCTDKTRANKIKTILDEKYPEIVDVEELDGTFLDVDFAGQTPSFAIKETDTDEIIKGKIDDGLRDKLTSDYINILKTPYTFRIRTVYKPETTLRPEAVRKTLLDYKAVDAPSA